MKKPRCIIFRNWNPFLPKGEHEIRINISGIDNGHAVCLETTVKRESIEEVDLLIEKIAECLKSVEIYKENE